MRLLLDTHTFLWFVTRSDKLSPGWRDLIRDPANVVFLSVASVWETVIKHAAGKLPLDESPEEYLPSDRGRHGIFSLPFDEDTIRFLARLPSIHKDPFDRILIA
jgi:PIN domain nuclease of toxin-antitoxin system